MKNLDDIKLLSGAHTSPRSGLCAMEAVAWLAGEPHSDRPACACPVLAAYVRVLNDSMPEKQRQRLKDFLPKLVGSRDEKLALERARVLAWAAITVFAPTALHAIGLVDHAAAMRALPKYDWSAARSAAWSAAESARSARSAAESAAESAARSAAWSARSAARSAAWSAAESAWSAAESARSAARSAAESAARSAAWSAENSVWDLALAALQQALDVTHDAKPEAAP